MVRALPKNYERIFALVCELPPGVHRTAGELFIEAHARYPAMGVSTVYRGLTRLRDLGLIAEIQLPGASSAVYERAVPSHIDNPISDVSLTFHGTCQACSAA